MSDDTRKERKPIEDEKLDRVNGGYEIVRNPIAAPRPPGNPEPPKNPLRQPLPD